MTAGFFDDRSAAGREPTFDDLETTGAAAPSWLARAAAAARSGTTDLVRGAVFRAPDGARRKPAAVLIACDGETLDDARIVLTQRSTRLRSHPGQVAFPGGRIDAGDAGPVGAALREAREEALIDPAEMRVLGRFTPAHLLYSGFDVTAVLAWTPRFRLLAPGSEAEVVHVEAVPVRELVDPSRRGTTALGTDRRGPAWDLTSLFVWGFTGLLLDAFLELGGLSEPWDPARYLEIPDPMRSVTHEHSADRPEGADS